MIGRKPWSFVLGSLLLGLLLSTSTAALFSVAALAEVPSVDAPLAASPSTVTSAETPAELVRLNGRWKLDWDKSESFDPVMDLLEVPWLVKRLSGVVPVYATFEVEPPTCESCATTMRIHQENPIRNTTRVVVLDGKPEPFTDPLGNESMDRFIWSGDEGLEMVRERILKSGKKAKILDRRYVEDDLASMVSTMTVWIDGEERASIRRVMVRADDEK